MNNKSLKSLNAQLIKSKYLKRSCVTNQILFEGKKIGYFYREQPDEEEDSGWRFMVGDESDEYMSYIENSSYVSLAKVLSKDSSVLDYLDYPIDSCFAKDASGNFIEITTNTLENQK